MIIIPPFFDNKCAAECLGSVQRNQIITNSITVQLFIEYNARNLFRFDDTL